MGGDDSQKLLPWRGPTPLRGANLRLTTNQHCNRKLRWGSRGAPLPSQSDRGSATDCLGHSWKAQMGQFSRAPKPPLAPKGEG